jgi:hypothetical protein
VTPEEHSAATAELIAAWIDWDAACQVKPRFPSGLWCEAQAWRLTAAETVLGMPLGYTARIAALRWRKDATGKQVPWMDVGDAVETVVLELVGPVAPLDQLPTPNEHRRAS